MNTPRIITKRQLIRDVPKRWREQYGDVPRVDWKYGVAEALQAIDPETATEAQIEMIIGNGSWTRMVCDQCRKEVDTLVELGQEPDYESHTASLCPACIKTAFDLSIK